MDTFRLGTQPILLFAWIPAIYTKSSISVGGLPTVHRGRYIFRYAVENSLAPSTTCSATNMTHPPLFSNILSYIDYYGSFADILVSDLISQCNSQYASSEDASSRYLLCYKAPF